MSTNSNSKLHSENIRNKYFSGSSDNMYDDTWRWSYKKEHNKDNWSQGKTGHTLNVFRTLFF